MVNSKGIEKFIMTLSSSYDNLNSKDLYEIWKKICENDVVKKEDVKKEDVKKEDDELSHENLLKANMNILKALCKKNGYKVSGRKEELINRLMGNETSKKKVTKSTKKKETSKIQSRVSKLAPTLELRKNQFGNYEHPETKFVFNKLTKSVFGKQDENGKVQELEKDDIELCKKFKFEYDLPENLNKTGIKISKIEDEDEDIDLDELEEIEEVEELSEDSDNED